jgi:hypothetical protein
MAAHTMRLALEIPIAHARHADAKAHRGLTVALTPGAVRAGGDVATRLAARRAPAPLARNAAPA